MTGLRKLTAWHQLADSCALLSRERFTGLPAFEVLEEGRAGVRAAAASRKVGRSCGTINVTPKCWPTWSLRRSPQSEAHLRRCHARSPAKKRDGSRIDGRRPHDVSGPLSASQTFSIATSPAGLCQWIGRMSPYRRLRRQMPPATRPAAMTVQAHTGELGGRELRMPQAGPKALKAGTRGNARRLSAAAERWAPRPLPLSSGRFLGPGIGAWAGVQRSAARCACASVSASRLLSHV